MKNNIKIGLLFCFILFNAKQNFALSSENLSDSIKIMDNDSIYQRADVMPSYPGGIVELLKFIQSNIKYPELAKKKKLEGKVIVKFYIDTDGSVKNPILLKDGVGGGTGDEAIRVILSMPKWNTAIQNEKPVKAYYVLPVTFKLK